MDKNELRKKWWEPYSGLMIDISGWLVVPVVAGLFIGRWLDNRFQTKPWLMLLSLGAAFVITNIAIARKGMEMMRKAQDETEKQNKKDNEHDYGHHD